MQRPAQPPAPTSATCRQATQRGTTLARFELGLGCTALAALAACSLKQCIIAADGEVQAEILLSSTPQPNTRLFTLDSATPPPQVQVPPCTANTEHRGTAARQQLSPAPDAQSLWSTTGVPTRSASSLGVC